MTKPGPNQISLANVPVSRLENTAIEPKDFLTNDQTHNDHKKRGQACLTRVAPAIPSPWQANDNHPGRGIGHLTHIFCICLADILANLLPLYLGVGGSPVEREGIMTFQGAARQLEWAREKGLQCPSAGSETVLVHFGPMHFFPPHDQLGASFAFPTMILCTSPMYSSL